MEGRGGHSIGSHYCLSVCLCVCVCVRALGCILYQMLAGCPPFKAETEFLTFQRICRCDIAFPNVRALVARTRSNQNGMCVCVCVCVCIHSSVRICRRWLVIW